MASTATHISPTITSSSLSHLSSESVQAKNRNVASVCFSRSRSEVLGSLSSSILGKSVSSTTRQGCVNAKPFALRIEAAKRVSTGRNYVLSSTLIVEKGKEEEALKLCKNILQWGQEKMGDKKSGVLQFDCNVDAFDKNVFHFWERYASFTTMNDARASPEHCKFMDEVRPFLTEPVALAAYEYNNGQIGCMLNPIGPKGEGGLDDATGQGGSGGGASYKQTSQSVMQGISDREGWGLDRALEISQTRGVAAAAKEAQEAIANSLKNLFQNKDKQ